jgi:DNA-binding LytR/AlgR family response regulator
LDGCEQRVFELARRFPSREAEQRYLYVATIGVPVTAGMTWANWRTALHVSPAQASQPGTAQLAFFARLPAKLGKDLLAIKAEDHYLRIYTTAGNDLLLMRLTDAVEELDGYDGLRVHRSYWVAHAAIERAEKAGRRVTLHLVNGMRVPVSRRYAEDLKAQGWLGD